MLVATLRYATCGTAGGEEDETRRVTEGINSL